MASSMVGGGVCTLFERHVRTFTGRVDGFELAQEDAEALAVKFDYLDFDPVRIVRKVFEQKVVKNRSTEEFLMDMVTMSCFFLTRGTNLTKMLRTMRPDGVNLVKELIQNYNLKKGQVPPEELTLRRVSLTFYSLTVRSAKWFAEHLPVKPSFMATISPGYPPGLMTQAVVAAIPIDKSYTLTLVHAYCLYLIEFVRVINPKLKNWGEGDILHSCLPALRAALHKRYPSTDDSNVDLLILVDVLTRPSQDEQEAPTEAVSRAAAVFRNRHGNVYII